MRAAILARLTADSEAPSGVAVRVDAAEMKRLLEERSALLAAAVACRRQMQNTLYEKPRVGMESECALADAAIELAEAE